MRKISKSEERGASLVEYTLLVALIAIVAIVSVKALGEVVDREVKEVNNGIQGAGGVIELEERPTI